MRVFAATIALWFAEHLDLPHDLCALLIALRIILYTQVVHVPVACFVFSLHIRHTRLSP